MGIKGFEIRAYFVFVTLQQRLHIRTLLDKLRHILKKYHNIRIIKLYLPFLINSIEIFQIFLFIIF